MTEIDVKNDTINISLKIKNTGTIPGKEIIQFYIKKMSSKIDRPSQELKAFTKTKLIEPDAMERVSVKIPIRELSYWDEKKNDWALEKGSYNIKVGASSRDIRQIEQLKF
jgi:beta-glucosidase